MSVAWFLPLDFSPCLEQLHPKLRWAQRATLSVGAVLEKAALMKRHGSWSQGMRCLQVCKCREELGCGNNCHCISICLFMSVFPICL